MPRYSSRKEFDRSYTDYLHSHPDAVLNEVFGPDGWRRDMTEEDKDKSWEDQRNNHD